MQFGDSLAECNCQGMCRTWTECVPTEHCLSQTDKSMISQCSQMAELNPSSHWQLWILHGWAIALLLNCSKCELVKRENFDCHRSSVNLLWLLTTQNCLLAAVGQSVTSHWQPAISCLTIFGDGPSFALQLGTASSAHDSQTPWRFQVFLDFPKWAVPPGLGLSALRLLYECLLGNAPLPLGQLRFAPAGLKEGQPRPDVLGNQSLGHGQMLQPHRSPTPTLTLQHYPNPTHPTPSHLSVLHGFLCLALASLKKIQVKNLYWFRSCVYLKFCGDIVTDNIHFMAREPGFLEWHGEGNACGVWTSNRKNNAGCPPATVAVCIPQSDAFWEKYDC